MKYLNLFFSGLLLSGSVLLVSCDDNDPAKALEATTVSNLAADPATGFDPNTGQPIGTTGKYKLFSFSKGEAIANTDSATSLWDIGFRGTTLIINSAVSGPGDASAQVVDGIFDEYFEAPSEGYKQDGATKAIPTGSGNGWYTASQTQPTIISPIAGKIIVIHTADDKYVKMEILSYYKDAPASPTGTEPARYYTFRYIYQGDGSRNLK